MYWSRTFLCLIPGRRVSKKEKEEEGEKEEKEEKGRRKDKSRRGKERSCCE